MEVSNSYECNSESMSVSSSSYSFDKRIGTDIQTSKLSNNSATITFSKVKQNTYSGWQIIFL